MFKNIVVGFDGSVQSENALKVACDLAQKYGSDVHVSHTPRHETVAFAMGAVAGYHAVTTKPKPDEIDAAAEKVFDRARSVAKEAGQVDLSVHKGMGDPAHDMLDVAQSANADLIVTGRRGLGNVGALVLGSTSYHVAHHAKCACMSVGEDELS